MNGLYGYPMSGVQGMAFIGAEPEEAVNTVWDVARGTAAKKLEKLKKQVNEQTKRLNGLRKEAEGIQNQSAVAALEVYQLGIDENVKARRELNKAIREHNKIAQALKDYTLGAVKPPTVGMAGMGAAQIPVAAILAVAVAVSVSAIALTTLINSITGANLKVKGYIAQMADLVREAGGTATAGGAAISRTAWAVIGVVGAIAAYQLLQDYRRGRSRPRTSPPPLPKRAASVDLKPVVGKVVA